MPVLEDLPFEAQLMVFEHVRRLGECGSARLLLICKSLYDAAERSLLHTVRIAENAAALLRYSNKHPDKFKLIRRLEYSEDWIKTGCCDATEQSAHLCKAVLSTVLYLCADPLETLVLDVHHQNGIQSLLLPKLNMLSKLCFEGIDMDDLEHLLNHLSPALRRLDLKSCSLYRAIQIPADIQITSLSLIDCYTLADRFDACEFDTLSHVTLLGQSTASHKSILSKSRATLASAYISPFEWDDRVEDIDILHNPIDFSYLQDTSQHVNLSRLRIAFLSCHDAYLLPTSLTNLQLVAITHYKSMVFIDLLCRDDWLPNLKQLEASVEPYTFQDSAGLLHGAEGALAVPRKACRKLLRRRGVEIADDFLSVFTGSVVFEFDSEF